MEENVLFSPLDIGDDKSHRCKVGLAGLNMTKVVIWGSPSSRCRRTACHQATIAGCSKYSSDSFKEVKVKDRLTSQLGA